jgi:hypothetical protein
VLGGGKIQNGGRSACRGIGQADEHVREPSLLPGAPGLHQNWQIFNLGFPVAEQCTQPSASSALTGATFPQPLYEAGLRAPKCLLSKSFPTVLTIRRNLPAALFLIAGLLEHAHERRAPPRRQRTAFLQGLRISCHPLTYRFCPLELLLNCTG